MIQAELRRTTQEDLKAILKTSEIQEKAKVAAAPEVAQKLAALEKVATATTLNDIKTHDPKMYAALTSTSPASVDALNAQAVQKQLETAPKAPSKRKPYRSELEDLEGGAYDKYFKPVK